MSRRTIWIPDPLWARVLAAVSRMRRTGRDVSLAAFIRRGIERELEVEEARYTEAEDG